MPRRIPIPKGKSAAAELFRSFVGRQDLTTGWADASSSSALVEVTGSLLVPDRIEVAFLGSTKDGQPALHMTLEVRDGLPQCRELSVSSYPGGRPVTSHDLGAVRLDEWVDAMFALYAFEIGPNGVGERLGGGPAGDEQTRRLLSEFQRQRRKTQRNAITPELLERVVAIYKENAKDRPIWHIANQEFVNERRARSWVAIARERGLLPATTRGKVTV